MLKLRKIATSVVAMLLVVVMGLSTAFAGQTNSVTVKETNNLEATEENKNDIKETRKIRVTRSGKNFIVYNMQQLINENRAHMKGLVYIEEDGIYGPKTRNAFIRFWQSTVCEKLGYDAIAIDGIFGAKSKAISR